MTPNSFEKMSVKLATQVFSHSVSSAMRTAVDMGQLPPEAEETAVFIAKLNNVFDAMNSKRRFDVNPYRCAISSSTEKHLKTSLDSIAEALQWTKSWKMINVKNNPPSFEGLAHTLNAVLLLWNDLEQEGVNFLLTGRLNQDPLENEFAISRQRCGNDRNPSARMFRLNLRHRIMTILIKPPSGSYNISLHGNLYNRLPKWKRETAL